jgi:hypothetical protein
MSKEDFIKRIKTDSKFAETFKYSPMELVSLSGYACKLLSAVYGANTMSGGNSTLREANEAFREGGIYYNDDLLTTENFEEGMELLTGGQFDVQLVGEYTSMSLEMLQDFEDSSDMYLAHLRLKSTQTGDNWHSVMMDSFTPEYFYGQTGRIKSIEVANPYEGKSVHGSGRQTVGPQDVFRWDIFRVVPMPEYYYSHPWMIDYMPETTYWETD